MDWLGKEAISIVGYLLGLGAIVVIGNAIRKNNKKHYEAGKADAYLEFDRLSPAKKRRR